MSTRKSEATAIEPGVLYALPAFRKASGLGRESIRLAKLRGIELPTLKVGRRKYVRGSDGIAFVEAAAKGRI